MLLILICIAIAVWVLYMGFKFYRSMDWNNRRNPAPILGKCIRKKRNFCMFKRFSQEACAAGKLSKGALEEYIRYAETEMDHMKAIKKAWDERPRT